MKKSFLMLVFCCSLLQIKAITPVISERYRISFQVFANPVYWEDPTLGQTQLPKMPPHAPEVYISGYTLYIWGSHADMPLRLLDEFGETVYETTVMEAADEQSLPSTLSGEYELQLVTERFTYSGWIEL